MRKNIFLLFCALVNLIVFSCAGKDLDTEAKNHFEKKINLSGFQENKGQVVDFNGKQVPFVLFKAEAPGLNLFVTDKGITYCFFEMKESEDENWDELDEYKKEKLEGRWSRIDLELKGANLRKNKIVTNGRSEYFSQYFLGHCPDGIKDVHYYTKIIIKEVYPGIDWVLYNANETGFKYDFIVHPGADPNQIELIYSSLKQLQIERNGSLKIKTNSGILTENAPRSFSGGAEIKTRFIKTKSIKNSNGGFDTSIKFYFPDLEFSHLDTLIIDPQLVWATFYGGNGADGGMSVDCDINGNVYVVGYTQQFTGFPTVQHTGNPSAFYDNTLGVGGVVRNVFILKFNRTGTRIWATYYSGAGGDWATAYSVKTDNVGNVLVVGSGSNIPTQAYTGNPPAYFNNTVPGGFILKFDGIGNRLWATYYPGTSPREVALDATGNIYVTGYTNGNLFTQPYTGNPAAYFQAAGPSGDAFILKFSNVGNLIWATCYGGTSGDQGASIIIDATGNIYVAGTTGSTDFPLQVWGVAFQQAVKSINNDVFILRFTSTGIRTWATYYGGNDTEVASSIRTDANGNVFVTGLTRSTNFPVLSWGSAYYQAAIAGNDDTFIIRFNTLGVRTWATYYGDVGIEDLYSYDNLEIDNCGNVYLGFGAYSASANLFTVNPGCGAYFKGTHGGGRDAFFVKFNNIGNVIWATYWGGTGSDFATPIGINAQNELYISGEWAGYTSTASLPAINPGGGAYFQNPASTNHEVYVARFVADTPPSIVPANVNSTSCSPCNGSATAAVTCGIAPYNYFWSNGSQVLNTPSVTSSITGLCPGTYTITVSSQCVQNFTATFVISGTACNGVNVQASNANICPGSCATINSTANGGTSPYTYSWSSGATTQNLNTCPVSTTSYTIKITDSGGATSTSTAIVTVNPAVIVNINPTNISCNGGTNGSAIAAGSSGSTPYTYTWSNGGNTSTISNLTPQNYTVTITDSKGCTSTSVATIIAPPTLTGQFTKGTSNCIGCGCKDWLIINATGGTSPYTYTWPDGYVNRYKNQLCPGLYLVNVKDKNGCNVTVNISSP